MIKNYLKMAWRNLMKNKVSSSLNIAGLASGMAVAVLIGLWIWDELSFDHYHTNHQRIAEVKSVSTNDKNEKLVSTTIAMPLADELRSKYDADFKHIALVLRNKTHILSSGDKKLSASGTWAEEDFPELFTLFMLEGGRDVLKDPSSLLLSESLARALFGNMDALGKTIRIDNSFDLTVAGVYKDLPHNSTFHETKYLLPWENKNNWKTTDWHNHTAWLFVELNDHVEMDLASAKIKNVPTTHVTSHNEEIMLYPLDKRYLYNEFNNGELAGGRIHFVWLFGVIGIFVLVLACINFMNLSTARSEKRAKEVGIRKAIGSLRKQLIIQFLGESLMVAFIAFVLAIVLVQLALPFFNTLADKQMCLPWSNPLFWTVLIAFTFFTGLISGSYPAFYLSGFEPVRVLKGTVHFGRFASLPRRTLVVLQFTVSIILIIGTVIVFKQIQFAKERPVGYSREGLITVKKNTPQLYQHSEAIRNELLQTGAVEDMGESNSLTTEVSSNNNGFSLKGQPDNSLPEFGTLAVSHDFGHTIGWQIIQGRDFSREFPTDQGAIIINEAAARVIGLKDPVGQILSYRGTIFDTTDHRIVGVIKDMVMRSPYEPVKPVMFFCNEEWTNSMTIRISRHMPVQSALEKIEAVFKKYNPAAPFDYKFTDETYEKKFLAEQRIGNLGAVFAILAIFISCLGLFGLASFVAEKRTKEIGVRKVLGATVFSLWKMLSKEFVVLVIISSLIAIPLSQYLLQQWLLKYEYRTGISWWIFAAAGAGALFMTLLTISYQALKAAVMNPVKSLRSE